MARNGGLLTNVAHVVGAGVVLILLTTNGRAIAQSSQARATSSDDDLRYWLENMAWRHRFSNEEIGAATGLAESEVATTLRRFDIRGDNAPPLPGDRLLVLPYPGGRHPRIGFLEGAVDPQRETKVSVFTPWLNGVDGPASYVVVDCPEAIWSNLGLTYLAHTHVPTVWTKQNVELPAQEWERRDDGSLFSRRKLPNGIEFAATVVPRKDHVEMTLTLTNGTSEALSDLRVQMCAMLKGAPGFTAQSSDNKRAIGPYALAHDEGGRRWIITCWKPNHRTWFNERCPCLHSDPKFPGCAPGETQTLRGWLSFYEGDGIEGEVQRIEELEWWRPR
jgi:hypothetical protein